MKIALLALAGLSFSILGHVHAQTTTSTPDTTTPTAAVAVVEREEATGTITDLTPSKSLVLHTGTNAGEPMVFRFGPEVTYVASDGKTVEAAGLRKNLRVRVSYVKTGGENIIDRVTILD